MLQRVIAAVLIALGVLSAGLAVASATVWRPDDVVTATSSAQGATTLLTVEPGVLDIVSDDVTVTASRPDGGDVAIALGREVDVRGWVGDDAHLSVTGLASWSSLATTFVAGETTPVEPADDASAEPSGTPSDTESTKASDDASATPTDSAAPAPSVGDPGLVGPDPTDSDMWFSASSAPSTAALTDVVAPAGRTMVLVASVGDGAPAPVLTLSWTREVTTPWLVPGIVVGALLVLVGVLVLLAASRGGLRAVGVSARRSILETSARAASSVSTRRGGTPTTDGASAPASPATPAPGLRPTTSPVTPSATTRGTPAPTWPPAERTPSGSPSAPAAGASPYGPPRTSPTPAGTATSAPDRAPTASAAGVAPAAGPSPYAARPSAPTSASATETPAAARPLTRREMREQAEREAAAAALEKSRRRPRTGTLPVVRAARSGAEPTGSQPVVPPVVAPAPTAPSEDPVAARADAWRRAWGFEQQTWSPGADDPAPTPPEEDA